MVGQVVTPCWLLSNGHSAPGADGRRLNGFHLSAGRFRQSSDYRFDSGHRLRVQQTGQGERDGYVLVESLLDGSVPEFPGLRVFSAGGDRKAKGLKS